MNQLEFTLSPSPEEIDRLRRKHRLVGTLLLSPEVVEQTVGCDSRNGIGLHGNGFLTINGESTAPAQETVPFIT